MNTYYKITDKLNEIIFCNYPHYVKLFLNEENSKNKIETKTITHDNQNHQFRIGRKTNEYGEIELITFEKRYVNNLKLFRIQLGIFLGFVKESILLKKEIENEQNNYLSELLHNVTTVNSYSIQELYSLIPQNQSAENINEQKDSILKSIKEKPNVTVDILLKLMKYNLMSKIEFSVFEKTINSSVSTSKVEYSIREIVLTVFQIFLEDFDKRKIKVILKQCDSELTVDYESLLVSLFYVFENASKYCCNNSTFTIAFIDDEKGFKLNFNMLSLRIEENEIDKLFEKNYRGRHADLVKKDGNGIGFYRIKKTLKLNDAEIEVKPRTNKYSREYNNIPYESNDINIIFLNQHEWYKN